MPFNNTIVWNTADGFGGAPYSENGSPVVLNTILWDDVASADSEIAINGGTSQITFSDIMGGWFGDGNINCDPSFCDTINGDFHVSYISCCMNGGAGGVNIGAYELGCTGDFLPGDANASEAVNGVDVVYMVNYFKDLGPAFPPPIWRADANGNCLVNGIDVGYLINFLKGPGLAPRDGNCVGAGSVPGGNSRDSAK